MKRIAKMLVSVLVCLLAGLAGLALVFRDLPVEPGRGLIALGGLFYMAVGFLLVKGHGGKRHILLGIAPGWGLGLLGLVGVWVSATDPRSGDWSLALLFLLGPALAGLAGALLARMTRRADFLQG